MKYKILFCMFLTILVLVSFIMAEEPKIINPNSTCIEPDCIIINPPEPPEEEPIYFINITLNLTFARVGHCEKNIEKYNSINELKDYYCESIGKDTKKCFKYMKLSKKYLERVRNYCVYECTDSDNRDYYTKGFTKTGFFDSDYWSGYWDTCYNDYQLVEYYCENNKGTKEIIECPYGCQDGACLKISPT